ncbi:MAG: HD domain-containing protein [Lachnospiraceae bacterium]|nr:HD domain-containing protein [Lachnospiraceae bacterium]
MKAYSRRLDKNSIRGLIYIIGGIIINVLLAYGTRKIGVPIHLDTIGTIGISALMGLFPGIVTAVATNVLCTFFNPNAIYFSIINVFIAALTVHFSNKYTKGKKGLTAAFMIILGLVSGALSAIIQWGVIGGPTNQAVADVVENYSLLPRFFTFLILNIVLDIFDKGLSVGIVMIIISFIPRSERLLFRHFGWKMRSLPDDELKLIRKKDRDEGHSIGKRMSLTLVGVSMVLVIIMGVICVHMYFDNLKEERTQAARIAVKFAADVIDTDRIDEYMRIGRDAEGYEETMQLLYRIRDNAQGVKYLYIVKVEADGCYFVFDLDTEDDPGYDPGAKVEVEEAFLPLMDKLRAGEEIDPIENDGIWGWVMTVYYPVRDEGGRTVCYAGADVSLDYTADYMRTFIVKVVLILAGFFTLAIAFGLWATNINTVYPIGAITSRVDSLADFGDSQDKLDENVKNIRMLDIRTDDEIERLYRAICNMTLEQAERMRQIRHFAETTSKMQDGLIITMADMVESRDSDTGAHVQKTSAYVRIIVEGLRKKGYYVEKISDKYISDVVRSAPLHDVGKINISDAVLNKPGKLTDEEFEIMKTHTTAGRIIIEKAISTVHGENYLREARNMAAYHHERWDGKGYPEGLHGEVIPLAARIMSVADVFDALTSPRVYKPAFPLDKALSIIQEGAGTQFDPKCVEVFMENLNEVKVILKKYNNQDV